ncbi:MAG: NAD kinase [Flavobacteriales bacterium]
MKIALYGKKFSEEHLGGIERLVDAMVRRGLGLVVHDSFYPYLSSQVTLPASAEKFHSHEDLVGMKFLLSIGGDGTLLETAHIVRDSKVAVLGINTGRLGFLSQVHLNDVEMALEALINEDFTLDYRSLIEVKSEQQEFGDFPYALNEVSLVNKERSAMITMHAYVNDQFMNTYWADGLIIATPTGSTAYSLSCGGPIVMPESNNVIMTPIAPHNLNVRPVVISNTSKISLRAEGRDPKFLLSLDSRSFLIDNETILEISRAPFQFSLINLQNHSFFNTIREKMGWGLDVRSKK